MCTYLNCAYIWSAQIQICIIWYSKWQGLWKFLNDVTIQQYITTSRVTCECVVMPNVHFNIYVAAYCIWSVLSLVSNLNPSSRSRSLVCHVMLKRDRWNGDWRLRMNDTPNAISCTCPQVVLNGRMFRSFVRCWKGNEWCHTRMSRFTTHILRCWFRCIYLLFATFFDGNVHT